ncbi:DUF4199 domain-containing protein [Olleya aquimaris]|uniref:DUF4199 domain-containing protein n=1 Tax=Olleya sediminilitoris TaxID=2795739 RepID=A0ABS1WJR8_9FLAO|nr:DUF4199 domain-containing protein [Olleya sediminilitoris]AXO79799.1 DUF4199 domain-containing protein [Olleya aquimaris]MBL7559364.1 DUF4199 domain-containing protein [Olleya sediminilitoris]
MDKTIKSIATNFGIYLGVILSSVTVIAYATNLELLTQAWLGISLFVAIIVFGIIAVSKSKSALGGYISFKEAFTAYFITVMIGILINAVISVIIFNFIDPEAAVTLKELVIEKSIEMMRNFNTPEDALADALNQMENSPSQFAISSMVQSVIIQLIIYSVIGLIISLIMKKNNEDL